jgi:hypothetical protein
MNIMMNIKKDFQKVIKAIRDDRNNRLQINGCFPKAIMTQVQAEKGQATVNCGGEWTTAEKSKERAVEVMQDSRFVEFLEKANAKATIEYNNAVNAYQVRLFF